jgi:RNA polymerase sporulation-specific sigma factor
VISLALAMASFARDLTLVTGYVNQSFPQPLTKEQEKEHFARWLNGDRTAYQALVEHNLRLVAHVAKKFDSSGIDHDDLISIGTVGLIKAVDTFQPTKGTKFATYAARCIQNEILMQLRALKKTRKDVSLNSPIGTDKEGNEFWLGGYLCSWHSYIRIQLIELIQGFLIK